jgi:hypothetical protein
LKNARERMDVIAAYRDVGSYRGAAEICVPPTRRCAGSSKRMRPAGCRYGTVGDETSTR